MVTGKGKDTNDTQEPGPRREADDRTNADAGLTGGEGAPPAGPSEGAVEEDRDEEIDKMARIRDEEPEEERGRERPSAPSVGDVFRSGG